MCARSKLSLSQGPIQPTKHCFVFYVKFVCLQLVQAPLNLKYFRHHQVRTRSPNPFLSQLLPSTPVPAQYRRQRRQLLSSLIVNHVWNLWLLQFLKGKGSSILLFSPRTQRKSRLEEILCIRRLLLFLYRLYFGSDSVICLEIAMS